MFLILGDDLHVKYALPIELKNRNWTNLKNCSKENTRNFADSVTCGSCRKCEKLEYDDLEGGTLPEYLHTCNNIQTLCPLDRELEYSPLEYLSVFLLTQHVLFDLQCSFSILFAEASYSGLLFSWFHWVRTAGTGLATATSTSQPSYQTSQN
jgi:hypothetical protein